MNFRRYWPAIAILALIAAMVYVGHKATSPAACDPRSARLGLRCGK